LLRVGRAGQQGDARRADDQMGELHRQNSERLRASPYPDVLTLYGPGWESFPTRAEVSVF
jgi:hypothetical protein